MVRQMELTIRQKAFADYYIELGNATEAAKKAGYKQKWAGTNADKLLKNTKVSAYIAKRLERQEDHRIATADDVMRFLSDVMNGKVKDQFGLEASLSDRINAGKELMKRHAVTDAAKSVEKVTVVIDV